MPRGLRRAASPRLTGAAVSLALHGALLAVLATVRVGATPAVVEPPQTPFAAALVARAPSPDEVVAAAPVVAAAVPETEAIPIPDVPEIVAPTPPTESAEDPPPATPLRPGPRADTFRRAVASARPGRGGAGAVGASGPAASSIGIGGGAAGRAGGGGDGGPAPGLGRGAGDVGAGAGLRARGGATRAPAAVGALPPPAYPSRARARGREGRVLLVLTIDSLGRVIDAVVAETSGSPDLDAAAREAATAWTFAPALADGEPVAGTLRVPVRFELTD